jgi:hypothetical protein
LRARFGRTASALTAPAHKPTCACRHPANTSSPQHLQPPCLACVVRQCNSCPSRLGDGIIRPRRRVGAARERTQERGYRAHCDPNPQRLYALHVFSLAVLLDRLSERLRWTRLDGAPLISRRKFG